MQKEVKMTIVHFQVNFDCVLRTSLDIFGYKIDVLCFFFIALFFLKVLVLGRGIHCYFVFVEQLFQKF